MAALAEQPLAHLIFDLLADLVQFIEHRLVLQNADVDIPRGRLGDDERDDRRPVRHMPQALRSADAIASMNRSIPLLRYSYRPLVNR